MIPDREHLKPMYYKGIMIRFIKDKHGVLAMSGQQTTIDWAEGKTKTEAYNKIKKKIK